MTTFIVYAGPNGSGKSSVRDMIESPVAIVIDPDRIARQINPDAPRSVDRQAGEQAIRTFDAALAAKQSVSMETTLTGHSAVRRLEQAKAAGYEVLLVFVALSDPELNVIRVAERARQGGHAIEPDTVRRRVGRSIENLPRALAIADQSIVFDNSGAKHRRVLEVADGRITYLADKVPEWLDQQMPRIAGDLLAQREAASAKLSAAPSSAAKAEPPSPPRPRSLTSLLNNLRTAEPEARQPWEPAAVPMAERIRAFEAKAAEAKATPKQPEPEPDAPRPRSGPRP